LTEARAVAILRRMVKYQQHKLDRVFAALVDPTRRAILARLEEEDSVTVSALAQPFDIKLPAVMKHLDVLEDTNLIRRVKHGRIVNVSLAPQPLQEAMDWLARYERFWSPRLDRLAAHAEARERDAQAAGDLGERDE
jgi:DNA-binding transcriptional ArsR family regulator